MAFPTGILVLLSICLLYSKRGCLILATEARVIRSLDWAISSSFFALCFGMGGGPRRRDHGWL